MRSTTRGGAPPSRRPRRRRLVLPLTVTGIVLAAVAGYERRVLDGLDATPDPDVDGRLAFPAATVHAVATLDGGQLHVEDVGEGRPVVLLHGLGADRRLFAPLAERLTAAGLRAVAVDQRGFGRSSAVPSTFGFGGLVADVATVLEALDLHDAILVGHSLGGAVSLGLAVDRPDVVAARVAAVVVVNGAARGPPDRPLARAKAAALDMRVTELVGRHRRHGVVLARANFGASPRRSHVVAVRTIGTDSSAARRRGLIRRLLGIDLSGRLGDVDVPVVVLAGAADRVLPARESALIVSAIGRARLVVFDGAGHVLPVERCADVAAEVVRLAGELDRATT
jgi:pimeloyl-ACP methyl ester carboxylesterase